MVHTMEYYLAFVIMMVMMMEYDLVHPMDKKLDIQMELHCKRVVL